MMDSRVVTGGPKSVDDLLDYFRVDERLPHILCPGCGIGTAMNAVVRAFIETGVNRDELCVVSGIGCSSNLPVMIVMTRMLNASITNAIITTREALPTIWNAGCTR